MIHKRIIHFRYVLVIAVIATPVNALFFILSGVAHSIHGYIEYAKIGFLPSEAMHPGLYLLEGLDAFMVSLVFMVFGMGVARLFLFRPRAVGPTSWLVANQRLG